MSLWLIGVRCRPRHVLVVALLLIGILVEAMRIRALARSASTSSRNRSRSRGVWALRDTHVIAESLRQGARAIDGNAAAIMEAVSGAGEAKPAA